MLNAFFLPQLTLCFYLNFLCLNTSHLISFFFNYFCSICFLKSATVKECKFRAILSKYLVIFNYVTSSFCCRPPYNCLQMTRLPSFLSSLYNTSFYIKTYCAPIYGSQHIVLSPDGLGFYSGEKLRCISVVPFIGSEGVHLYGAPSKKRGGTVTL